MIVSASRRTDIPAFYSDWLVGRLEEGYLLVVNPMNRKQVSKIVLTPELVECIVFWTKNPHPILSKLSKIDLLGYRYYFQFTVNSYDRSVEPGVPEQDEIIVTFKKLSDQIGSEKVIWRYDPIFVSAKYSVAYHLKWFEYLAKQLSGFTSKCIISFLDMYKKCERKMEGIGVQVLSESQKKDLALSLSEIAKAHGIIIESCAESMELGDGGINHGKCIDDGLISKIIGCEIEAKKDPGQRNECRCISSVDIGTYNTCNHNCLYCYANLNREIVSANFNNHDKHSALLTGSLLGDEKITDRTMTIVRSKNTCCAIEKLEIN